MCMHVMMKFYQTQLQKPDIMMVSAEIFSVKHYTAQLKSSVVRTHELWLSNNSSMRLCQVVSLQ